MFARNVRTPVCLRCKIQRSSHYSTSSKDTHPFPSGKVRLSNRRLVSIHGTDAPRFLQGLTTNNVLKGQRDGYYCAFLSATGRVLWDAFIYPAQWSRKYREWLTGGESSAADSSAPTDATHNEPAYLVEIDGSEIDAFLRHLKRHKLRSKVDVRAVEQDAFSVWSVWREGDRWTPHTSSLPMGKDHNGNGATHSDPEASIQLVDSRAPGFGRRLILPTNSPANHLTHTISDLPEAPVTAYNIRRYLRGIPEGTAEIRRDVALPLEHNMDYMGGIDFHKGCYVGQELTIRTHHTGVVRKRVLPVVLYPAGGESHERSAPSSLEYDDGGFSQDQLPPPGTDIQKSGGKGRSAGKWIAGIGNVGLALCRLEPMTGIRLTAEAPQWTQEQEFEIRWADGDAEKRVGVKAFVPDWHKGKERPRGTARRL